MLHYNVYTTSDTHGINRQLSDGMNYHIKFNPLKLASLWI